MISGARYQRETIVFDFLLYMNEAFLANPKSAIFILPKNDCYYLKRIVPFLSSKILSGFMSL
jgi:hypothetical protein